MVEQKIFDIMGVASMQMDALLQSVSWGCAETAKLHGQGLRVFQAPALGCYRHLNGSLHALPAHAWHRLQQSTMESAISRQHADSAPPPVNTPLLETTEPPSDVTGAYKAALYLATKKEGAVLL